MLFWAATIALARFHKGGGVIRFKAMPKHFSGFVEDMKTGAVFSVLGRKVASYCNTLRV